MRCAAISRSWIRRISVASSRSAGLLAATLVFAGTVAAQQRATLSGRILRPVPGDTVAASGVRVVLHRVGQDAQGAVDSARTGPDGGFRFLTPRDTTALFLVSARYGGIEFFSPPVTFRDSAPPGPVELLVSDTSSAAPVEVGGRYLVVGAPTTGRQRTAVDLFVLRNDGYLTRVAVDSATPTWWAVLPVAQGHRVAEAGSEISASTVQFRGDTVLVFAPLSPGEKQLLLEHVFPAEWTEWFVPLESGTGQVQVVAEEPGVTVTGPGIALAEPQVMDDRRLSRWVGRSGAGAGMTMVFPGAAGAGSEQTLVGGLVGLAVVALAGFAWLGLRRRRGSGVAALLVLALAQGGCAAPAPSGGPSIVDDAGDTVTLARPAERVVSLIPAATEMLFAIGAGAAVVGRTDWCDAPPAAAAVPSVGGGLEPNIEAVVAARPDLVVLYPSPQTASAAARLRALGVPAMQWRTDRLADLVSGTARLGVLTGRAAAAAEVLGRLDASLAAAAGVAGARPRVLVLAWDQPPIAIGRGSFLHEIVDRAGGDNIFRDLDAPSGPVSLESIAERDPDVILAIDDLPDFAKRAQWQVVRAVREARFLVVTGTEFQRPTPRAAAAVARLVAAFDSLGFR